MKPGDSFTSHGYDYVIDPHGAVKQMHPKPFKYDEKYVQTYNTPEYLRESELLQSLRYGYCTLAHGSRINSILDVGYGAGQFMRYARKYTTKVYGHDVTGLPVDECEIVDDMNTFVDVVTFWDALEHMENLSFLDELNCLTVVVSLPYCHIHDEGIRWFENDYPHRKPNEHIRHFTPGSLGRTMDAHGWKTLWLPSQLEDAVRQSRHGLQNILTMAFKRVK